MIGIIVNGFRRMADELEKEKMKEKMRRDWKDEGGEGMVEEKPEGEKTDTEDDDEEEKEAE